MSNSLIYVGKDLEAMSFAENYHRWILDLFQPYLGARVVEVGAGTGAFSKLILERSIESLSLVEPSTDMFAALESWVKTVRTETIIDTYNSTFAEVAQQIATKQKPDSIIYVNVLEHIAEDRVELEHIHRSLGHGGRVFIFVPALQWLLGSFDEQIGHQRRYTKPALEEKCRSAGFQILKSGYLDLLGIVPWWIKYCLLRSKTMEASAVRVYDRYFVPAVRRAESFARPPLGKNVFVIAEKRDA